MAYVTSNGNPITGATVTFTSDNGGFFSGVKTQGNGYYETTFTAPSFSKTTNCTITATASKNEYLTSQATAQVSVGPSLAGNKTGVIQFCLKNDNGNALSNAIVSTIVQPAGVNSLSDLTNSTGYVTFKNLAAGTYTFRMIKDGYKEVNETINYIGGQPLALTITLISSAVDNSTLIIVVSIVVAATAIAVISALYIVKRKKTAKIRKLQDLQKHLKYKY
jgi:hypothetical protein